MFAKLSPDGRMAAYVVKNNIYVENLADGAVRALTTDGTLLSRGVVRSEFRTARDLLDRIDGGAGPRGLKAVAPLGSERISIDVPENVDEVSLLGEKLTVIGRNGTETFTGLQRPIATVSNIIIDYQPTPKAPAKPTAKPIIKKK